MTTETTLTDAEIITIGHQASGIEPGENGYILPVTFARAIEQAVLAKLAEQEPVAWYVDNDVTFDQKMAESWKKNLFIVKPLYAHPCVSESAESETQASGQGFLDSSESSEEYSGLELARHQPCGCVVCYCENQVQCLGCGAEHCWTHDVGEIPNPVYVDHIADASKMVDADHIPDIGKMITPLAQRKIQSLLDKGEYRVIENATVLVNENGHAAIVNHGGAFYWVDNEAIAREFDGAGVGVDNDHIADKRKKVPEGYTLVPVEADQALLISMACCLNHGFGLLDEVAQYSMLYDMEKLYDEVVGTGYYSQENRERYLAMLVAAPKYTEIKE